MKHCPDEEADLFRDINKAAFDFYKELQPKEKKDYILSFNFHVINSITHKIQLIHHQMTPLRLTPDGKIWLSLNVVSIPTNSTSNDIIISKYRSSKYWSYDLENKTWDERIIPTLNEAETKVLKYSAMGYDREDIADMLCKSLNSIKAYRKNIFSKLNVGNIAEAINFAKNHRLI